MVSTASYIGFVCSRQKNTIVAPKARPNFVTSVTPIWACHSRELQNPKQSRSKQTRIRAVTVLSLLLGFVIRPALILLHVYCVVEHLRFV